VVDQDDVGEAFDVLQPLGVLREHLDRAGDTLGSGGLYGCSFGFFERGMNDADWPVPYFVHGFIPSLVHNVSVHVFA